MHRKAISVHFQLLTNQSCEVQVDLKLSVMFWLRVMKMGIQDYHALPHEKKGMHLFPWCTRIENILGQLILTFGIHSFTMVGQAIHGGAAIHGPKDPFLAMVLTHFGCFVQEAIVWRLADLSLCTFLHISIAGMCFI